MKTPKRVRNYTPITIFIFFCYILISLMRFQSVNEEKIALQSRVGELEIQMESYVTIFQMDESCNEQLKAANFIQLKVLK